MHVLLISGSLNEEHHFGYSRISQLTDGDSGVWGSIIDLTLFSEWWSSLAPSRQWVDRTSSSWCVSNSSNTAESNTACEVALVSVRDTLTRSPRTRIATDEVGSRATLISQSPELDESELGSDTCTAGAPSLARRCFWFGRSRRVWSDRRRATANGMYLTISSKMADCSLRTVLACGRSAWRLRKSSRMDFRRSRSASLWRSRASVSDADLESPGLAESHSLGHSIDMCCVFCCSASVVYWNEAIQDNYREEDTVSLFYLSFCTLSFHESVAQTTNDDGRWLMENREPLLFEEHVFPHFWEGATWNNCLNWYTTVPEIETKVGIFHG